MRAVGGGGGRWHGRFGRYGTLPTARGAALGRRSTRWPARRWSYRRIGAFVSASAVRLTHPGASSNSSMVPARQGGITTRCRWLEVGGGGSDGGVRGRGGASEVYDVGNGKTQMSVLVAWVCGAAQHGGWGQRRGAWHAAGLRFEAVAVPSATQAGVVRPPGNSERAQLQAAPLRTTEELEGHSNSSNGGRAVRSERSAGPPAAVEQSQTGGLIWLDSRRYRR